MKGMLTATATVTGLRCAVYESTHPNGLVVGTATTLTAPSSPRPPPLPSPSPLPPATLPLKFLRRSLVALDAVRDVAPG